MYHLNSKNNIYLKKSAMMKVSYSFKKGSKYFWSAKSVTNIVTLICYTEFFKEFMHTSTKFMIEAIPSIVINKHNYIFTPQINNTDDVCALVYR